MTLIRLLFFQCGGLRLALDLRSVERALPTPILTPAAGAPPFLEGFFDYQGRAVAAVRLEQLIGAPADEPGLYAPLLLLAGREPPVALHVARVEGTLRTDADSIRSIDNAATFNGCVVGEFTHGNDTIYLLDADALLLAEERARLSAFAVREQARLDALGGASHAA